MLFIYFVVFGFLFIFSPVVRCAVFHPFLTVYHGIRDSIAYYKHRTMDVCRSGELVAYVGLFGKGKTLSAVHRVVAAYYRYNGKKVCDSAGACHIRGDTVTSEAQMRATRKYRDKAYDRIEITVPKGTRDCWRVLAEAEGKSLNAYIVSHVEGTPVPLEVPETTPESATDTP